MDNNIDQKIALLRENYAKKLPVKIGEIKEAWLHLEKDWTKENLTAMQRLAHNLRGTSATFGYEDLSHHAEKIEREMDLILSTSSIERPKPANVQSISSMIEDLNF